MRNLSNGYDISLVKVKTMSEFLWPSQKSWILNDGWFSHILYYICSNIILLNSNEMMAKYLFYRNNLATINRQTMFCYAIKEADFFPPTLIAKVFRLGLMRLVTHCTKSIGICSKIKLRLLFLVNNYYVHFLKTLTNF